MTDPFEDQAGQYAVLRNAEGRYSLWPTFVDVPHGWDVTSGETSHPDCVEYIDNTWTDKRPQSLVDAMDGN